jgi:hypothetical protein
MSFALALARGMSAAAASKERTKSRPLQRVCLESGLKLDLNRLVRRGIIKPGAITGPVDIAWTNGSGQEIASGYITADMSGERWLRIRLGRLDQCIYLVARPRHFGGCQWFFVCPHLHSLRLRFAIYGPHRQGSSGCGED